MSLRQQLTTQTMPVLRDLGIEHLVGAAEQGAGMQVTKSIVLAGASPHTITFASLESQGGNPIRAPIDVDYVPVVVGITLAQVNLTAGRTLSSFVITGGTAADVVAFVIHGRFGAMKR